MDPVLRNEEILDAAERAIRVHGPRASLTEVAGEAGFARSAVYAVFPGRSAVLSALSKRHASRILSGLARRTATVDSARERLEAFIDTLCAWIQDEPQLYRALSGSSVMDGEQIEDLFEELAIATEAMLAANLRARGASTGPAAPWARAMIGSVAAAAAWWQRTGDMSRAELVTHLTTMSWEGGARLPLGPHRAEP